MVHIKKIFLSLLTCLLFFKLMYTGFTMFVSGFASGKEPTTNAGDLRDLGLIPGWGRSPGVENGKPLQYSCLENPMDRGAWWATVHWVAKSWTQLKQLSTRIELIHNFVSLASILILILFDLRDTGIGSDFRAFQKCVPPKCGLQEAAQ